MSEPSLLIPRDGARRSWEDFVIGARITSAATTVTEAHIVAWAGLTGDWAPPHVDAEHAARTEFGERIAHGPLTLALALGLVTQTGEFDGVLLAWLGLNEGRTHAPVRLGGTIRAVVEVASSRLTSKPERGVCTLAYAVHNQHHRVVMTLQTSFLMRRRSRKGREDVAQAVAVAVEP